ncbi:MAG: isoamylase early set domain-containing protein [Gemmatimonadaceae bacterium]|nr:isoamylase early set domain-containing protein [Gemmatimonadaceae bacterium]
MRDEVVNDPVLRPFVETAQSLPERHPALVARILAATATPVRRPWWQRWPAPVLALATMAALVVVVQRRGAPAAPPAVATTGGEAPARGAPPTPRAVPARVASDGTELPATVAVHLTHEAPGATTVHVVGDFNGWDATAAPMQQLPDGAWVIDLDLAPGRHVYAFLIDGTRWAVDPRAPRAPDDDFGQGGSVLMVRAP